MRARSYLIGLSEELLKTEAVRCAWQPLVEEANEREEHLGRYEPIGVAILLEI